MLNRTTNTAMQTETKQESQTPSSSPPSYEEATASISPAALLEIQTRSNIQHSLTSHADATSLQALFIQRQRDDKKNQEEKKNNEQKSKFEAAVKSYQEALTEIKTYHSFDHPGRSPYYRMRRDWCDQYPPELDQDDMDRAWDIIQILANEGFSEARQWLIQEAAIINKRNADDDRAHGSKCAIM